MPYKNVKLISLGSLLLASLASFSQADIIHIDGVVASIVESPIWAENDAPFNGSLAWSDSLDGARIELGGFCLSTEYSGQPPTSPNCGNLTTVPILSSGQTGYNGNAAALGATFEQLATTFDGDVGLLKITSFSASFNTLFLVDLNFNGDGTGIINIDAGFLGSTAGTFNYTTVPVPAAAWLFGSGLLGLAAKTRKRKLL